MHFASLTGSKKKLIIDHTHWRNKGLAVSSRKRGVPKRLKHAGVEFSPDAPSAPSNDNERQNVELVRGAALRREKPINQVAIFHEIDDDMRYDRLRKPSTKYFAIFSIAIILIFSSLGANQYIKGNQFKAAQIIHKRFVDAEALQREGKNAEAAAIFDEISKSGPRGYSSLARLRLAEELEKTDKEKAVAAYGAIAEDRSVGKLTREAARLRLARIPLEMGDRRETVDASWAFNLLATDRYACKATNDRANMFKDPLYGGRQKASRRPGPAPILSDDVRQKEMRQPAIAPQSANQNGDSLRQRP